jgi:serine O-acetyltransferase
MTWRETFHLIKSDIKRRAYSDGRKPYWSSYLTLAMSPQGMTVIIIRLQRYFYCRGLYIISKILAVLNIIMFSTEVHPQCEISEGFMIGHASGVIIHGNARIGKNCILMHQCTLGIKEVENIPLSEVHVVLGDEVIVGAGARIMGNISIGHHSQIGMNAMVIKSFPPYSVIVGVPARQIKAISPDTSAPIDYRDSLKPIDNSIASPKKSLPNTFRLIREDLIYLSYVNGKSFNWTNYLKFILDPSAFSVVIFRFSHWLDGIGLRLLARILLFLNLVLFKVEIGVSADIAGGLVIGHANGVIINSRAKIGKNCIFFHHNTVAIAPRQNYDPLRDMVVIGDNVVFGAGARVVGNIEIGDNCRIGMNAVVNRSLPPNAIAVGIPARVVKILSEDYLTRKANNHALETLNGRLNHHQVTFRQTLRLIKADLLYRTQLEGKKLNFFYCLKLILNPPALVVIIFRFQTWFYDAGLYLLANLLYLINILLFSCDFQTGAEIEGGLVVSYANGIIIHSKAKIGKNCILMFHNSITIGPRLEMDPVNDRVILEDNVMVGGGARIIGNITIGHHSQIGMNAVVTRSAPPYAVLTGVPAKDRRNYPEKKG